MPQNYTDSINYLFGLQKFGIKLGLFNIKALLKYLGNPQKNLKCIHIAGSNGKGSTAAFLLSILEQSGYATGLFTSPHLIDFCERIRISNQLIKKGRVVHLTGEIKKICDRKPLAGITFFEFITAMAFKYFEEEKSDPVIVETGMGGRYDATNVIKPLISIITSITLEHQQYLGNTLTEIVREKAGIIKKEVPFICGVRQQRLRDFLINRSRDLNSPLYLLGRDIKHRKTGQSTFNYSGPGLNLRNIKCGLLGDHQFYNASMAAAAAEQLKSRGFDIKENHITEGIKKTVWHGRLEIVRKNPDIVLDGAHNPAAWKTLKKSLEKYFKDRPVIFLFGVMQDKDIRRMIEILIPGSYAVIFCKPKMERASSKKCIEKNIGFSRHKKIFWIDDSTAALNSALSMAETKAVVCVTGSLFLVGEIRQIMTDTQKHASGRIAM